MRNAPLPLLGFLILSVAVSLSGCEEGESNETSILKLTIHQSQFTNADIWIWATNQSGEVIAKKHWEREMPVTLSGNVSPDEDINILMLFTYDGASYHHLKIISGVKPDRVWQIGKGADPVEHSAPISVRWNNLQTDDRINGNISIYSLQNNFISGGGFTCLIPDYKNCVMDFVKYSVSDEMLFSQIPGKTTPRYFKTSALAGGLSYTFDFNTTFIPYDNSFTITADEGVLISRATIGGVANGIFHGQSHFTHEGTNTLTTGYNNGYAQYLGVVQSGIPFSKFYTWTVLKSFLSASDFVLPEEDITITDQSFSNFSFTVDWHKPFEYKLSIWYATWTHEAKARSLRIEQIGTTAKGGSILPAFPGEITTHYPGITTEGAEYSYTDFFFSEEEANYAQAVETIFSDPVDYSLKTSYQIRKFK